MTSGELELDHVATLSDEELISELTAVKGIGEWSAHMFLMFQLERPDVLATGDLGVRTRASSAPTASRSCPRPPSSRRSAEPWRPYRSAGVPRAVVVARQRSRLSAPQAASDQ